MALQDRAVNAPIARGQQIKVATQAQVSLHILLHSIFWCTPIVFSMSVQAVCAFRSWHIMSCRLSVVNTVRSAHACSGVSIPIILRVELSLTAAHERVVLASAGEPFSHPLTMLLMPAGTDVGRRAESITKCTVVARSTAALSRQVTSSDMISCIWTSLNPGVKYATVSVCSSSFCVSH